MEKNIVKPSILPGFMELLPAEQILFNKMLETIRKGYERYGFVPVDTPVIEKSEVLLAKGGGETEKQIYRFMKGDTDLSLRFDLTVPLARYVAQHFSSLTFPFRRYQISKVYRGERNQKGRFREFYQCDIDIIGNGKLSIINDAEIPSIIYSVFKELGFGDFTIRMNNRKVLNGFFESVRVTEKMEVLRIIDKLEKIGRKAVVDELRELNLDEDAISKILNFIEIKGKNEEIINALKSLNIENEGFNEGVKELEEVTRYVQYFGVPEKNYIIDLTIARGLDYYTGTVYETILDNYPQIGSVCSGGRYDNLAEYYTNQQLPGVGISIGLTRLFYQLQEAGFFGVEYPSSLTKVLLIPMDQEAAAFAIKTSNKLRENGITTEVYFDQGKIAKKFAYADKLGIRHVIVIGTDEMNSGNLTLKDMKTGTQESLTIDEITAKIV